MRKTIWVFIIGVIVGALSVIPIGLVARYQYVQLQNVKYLTKNLLNFIKGNEVCWSEMEKLVQEP